MFKKFENKSSSFLKGMEIARTGGQDIVDYIIKNEVISSECQQLMLVMIEYGDMIASMRQRASFEDIPDVRDKWFSQRLLPAIKGLNNLSPKEEA